MSKRGFLDGYRTYDTRRGHGRPREWRQEFASAMGLDEARARLGRRTPHDVLGVAADATWPQIKTAYRQRALDCHPDRCATHGLSVAAATTAFKQLTAAYTVLAAQHRRT